MLEKLISNTNLLRAVDEGIITLSETSSAVIDALNSKQVSEIQKPDIAFLSKMKTPVNTEEENRFYQVEQFVIEASDFLNKNLDWTIQRKNWKRFLILENDNTQIFEIIEQRWNIIIAKNPITKMHIIYKFEWEKSDKNNHILWWLDNITKTHIDWYYEVTWNNSYWWIYFPNDEKIINGKNYYYVWQNWETKHLWDFKNVWDLKQFWDTVYFEWSNHDSKNIVIHNWSWVNKIPYWWNIPRESESWRYFLHIINNIWNQQQNEKHSLFDLCLLIYVFQNADEFTFELKNEWWKEILWNEIEWDFKEKRRIFPWYRIKKIKQYLYGLHFGNKYIKD